MLELEEILVPVDFSPASRAAFEQALGMAAGEQPVVILQHVVDRGLASVIAAQGYGDEDAVLARMHEHARAALEALAAMAGGDVEVQPMVSEGTPFYEILRAADDLAVDAVVIGRKAVGGDPESVFFGSTAERVVRGCNRMVIVLPAEE